MRNPDTGIGKGFAFVRFVSADAAAVRRRRRAACAERALTRRRAQAAVEHLNGLEVCGRAVGVVRSQAHTQLFVGGCVAPHFACRFAVLRSRARR